MTNKHSTSQNSARGHALRRVLACTVTANPALSLLIVLAIAGSIAFTLIPPLVLKGIVDQLAAGQGVLLGTALLYFAMLALSGLFDACKDGAITVFGQKITHGLRSRMCEKIARLPAVYFSTHENGVVVSRFVNDVDTVEALFADGIIGMFTDVCTVVSIIVMIWTMSPGLGLLMLAVTPLLFWLTRFIQKRMLATQSANRVAIGRVNNHVPETIRNIRMITSFHRQRYLEKRYDDYIQDSYRCNDRSNFYDSVYSPLIIFTSAVVVAAMFLFAALGGDIQTFFGMSVGTAVAVVAYVGKVFSPLESIGMEIQNIQSAVAGVHRIDEFLDEEERPLPALDPADALDRVQENVQAGSVAAPCIELSDVDFGYDAEREVLHDLTLDVHAGEKVTLMGRTGAGKSTVLKLILGLYEPHAGRVRICGMAPEDIPDDAKRTVFGYVEQGIRLVPGTVADQIALYDSAITRAQVQAAARLVGLDDVISSLEHGYDTPCTADLFSQGQLQLLAIARACVANPAIMLLDEVTANLDSGTERQVMTALRDATGDRTVLSVSHRTAALDGGRVVTIG